ncbi:uncharacterized protein LOC125050140 [Pieris napi]|uniref:uncharacterized protein LOC125050140 n=1 Tax=Pieris napi TaxID=78633 RepID=UPI001FBAB5AE|nr:uncharacterized protein LOC125050140 [Pieris napi]
MSESRKNHLNIDGGQVKEDDHVASYKPISENDEDFRTSKSSLKKEKGSGDGAEEKLLSKEDEAKIVTRVDMADAKYVVEDHRNGDAKIELDANKRQFMGLTKEELMKYADDPMWVRLRWFMFVLFWAMWLCMLAGAIIIIIRAPKCAPPAPKKWFERGPLVDASSVEDYSAIDLPLLTNAKVAAVFAPSCKDTYSVLEDENVPCLKQFKEFVTKAKAAGIKVIVDLTANFVSTSHKWFKLSQNRSAEYNDYFTWRASTEFDPTNNTAKPPNNWVSTLNEPAWNLSPVREEFYLHQYGADQADLNFHNPAVVKQFDEVLKIWMKAGADGVRLQKARTLVVNNTNIEKAMEEPRAGRGIDHEADFTQYSYYQHKYTADQPALDELFSHWSHLVDATYAVPSAGESVFTIAEQDQPEWFLLERKTTSLRPVSTAPLPASDARAAVLALDQRIARWPLVQLNSPEPNIELAAFGMLMPAAPVLTMYQLQTTDNDTSTISLLSSLSLLRSDASIEHGMYNISATPTVNSPSTMLACTRWKIGHTGYVSLYNPGELAHADLSALYLPVLPLTLTVHHLTESTRLATNYTSHSEVRVDDIVVPARSTLILSFVPRTSVEN